VRRRDKGERDRKDIKTEGKERGRKILRQRQREERKGEREIKILGQAERERAE